MDWARDLGDWPLHRLSRRIACGPHLWHVQEAGRGPLLLLLHGAGASTHSWRALIPVLADTSRVIALDLPGQGFSRAGPRRRPGLAEMTEDIAALCAQEGWQPAAIIGHSAGAVIALSLALRPPAPGASLPAIICINAALGHFEGVAGWLFPLLARFLALNPLTALLFSAGRDHRGRARRLIEGTGSVIDAEGIALYARLIADRAHVEGTLKMMASWRIDPLLAALDRVEAPCLLIAGQNDRAVPPEVSAQAAARIAGAELRLLPGLGHLLHEEAPATACRLILDHLGRRPASPGTSGGAGI
ncbi:alpha/beta fold hydrolase BchO [Paracoccus spongiarum]|uniref:Alpha/beta fold hydrolase n=1 Tax=Paracoccus spongiarum TaxID=3064387 RepID=A0ABT9JCF7_9RHOB|nr:alpha/beta fold hydrolase BchO [Paracoccus sp. 2205BS29-5]MDP5307369.1 alpha/beta fold hydrolase [Paracoccus sp. 2205BS29-5]